MLAMNTVFAVASGSTANGVPLVYWTFMIDPFELAELIFDGPPGHPLFQLAEVSLRVNVIPQGIQLLRRQAIDDNTILHYSCIATLPDINVEEIANCALII